MRTASQFTIALAAVLLMAGGCKSTNAVATPSRSVIGIASSTARIDVRADVIASQAKHLPATPVKVAIVEQVGGIKADTRDAQAQLDNARDDMRLMEGTINNQKTEIAVASAELRRLNNVWIAPRMWRTIAWCVAGLAAAWVLSIALGVASPFGWGMSISKLLNTFLPFMTPATFIRDLLLSRSRGLTPAVVAKAAS